MLKNKGIKLEAIYDFMFIHITSLSQKVMWVFFRGCLEMIPGKVVGTW